MGCHSMGTHTHGFHGGYSPWVPVLIWTCGEAWKKLCGPNKDQVTGPVMAPTQGECINALEAMTQPPAEELAAHSAAVDENFTRLEQSIGALRAETQAKLDAIIALLM